MHTHSVKSRLSDHGLAICRRKRQEKATGRTHHNGIHTFTRLRRLQNAHTYSQVTVERSRASDLQPQTSQEKATDRTHHNGIRTCTRLRHLQNAHTYCQVAVERPRASGLQTQTSKEKATDRTHLTHRAPKTLAPHNGIRTFTRLRRLQNAHTYLLASKTRTSKENNGLYCVRPNVEEESL